MAEEKPKRAPPKLPDTPPIAANTAYDSYNPDTQKQPMTGVKPQTRQVFEKLKNRR